MKSESMRLLLLLLSVSLLLPQALPAGPASVESLIGDLDDFILANGRGEQAFANRFHVPLRLLINNSLTAFQLGARGDVFDKTLESLRCELLVLLDLLEKSGPAEHRPIVENAIGQVDAIRKDARSRDSEAKEESPADPEPVPPPEDECSIEIRRVAGPHVRRLLNGSLVLSRGTRLELRAQANPEGGQLVWEIHPDPGEFSTGSFSTDECSVCGTGRATFIAPTGVEGVTSYQVTASYTLESGESCRDEITLFAR